MVREYEKYSICLNDGTPKISLYVNNINVGSFLCEQTVDTFFFLGSRSLKYRLTHNKKEICTQITHDVCYYDSYETIVDYDSSGNEMSISIRLYHNGEHVLYGYEEDVDAFFFVNEKHRCLLLPKLKHVYVFY